MARENSFTFLGELEGAPVVLFNEETKTYRVTFTLKTLRRSGRVDYPKISIYSLDEETARKYVTKLKPGSFVQVRGMVATKIVKKPVQCEKCGEISRIDTLNSEIISYGNPYVFQEEINPAEITEFANSGNLIGSLCTDIQRRDSASSSTVAQFQLAVNRRYHVTELEKGSRTDYPWIRVIGNVADECLKRLHKSSQVYISGVFQTRDISRHVRCEKCGEEIVYAERVGEVLPMGIEFLNECLFDNKAKDANVKVSYEGSANEEA